MSSIAPTSPKAEFSSRQQSVIPEGRIGELIRAVNALKTDALKAAPEYHSPLGANIERVKDFLLQATRIPESPEWSLNQAKFWLENTNTLVQSYAKTNRIVGNPEVNAFDARYSLISKDLAKASLPPVPKKVVEERTDTIRETVTALVANHVEASAIQESFGKNIVKFMETFSGRMKAPNVDVPAEKRKLSHALDALGKNSQDKALILSKTRETELSLIDTFKVLISAVDAPE